MSLQKNIPDLNYGTKHFAGNYPSNDGELQLRLKRMNDALLSNREKRIRPGTDDKILTSWNCLMVKGFIDAFKAFGDQSFFIEGKKTLDFLLDKVCNDDHSVYRNYKNGKAGIPAFLDDYSFLISALIDFYQVSFEEKYLYKAKKLMEYVRLHFFDTLSGMFFYTDDRFSNLIARKTETTDNVIPSSNSGMAKNLLILGMYFENKGYCLEAEQMLKNIKTDAVKNPGYYSNWAQAMSFKIHAPFEIAIAGEGWKEKLSEFGKEFIPQTIFLGGENSTLPLLTDKLIPGKTMIYVCRNKTCALPVEEVTEALNQLKN